MLQYTFIWFKLHNGNNILNINLRDVQTVICFRLCSFNRTEIICSKHKFTCGFFILRMGIVEKILVYQIKNDIC